MPWEKKDLTGQRFGKLVVIEVAGKDKKGRYKWKCECDCGNKNFIVYSSSLTNGRTKSCGCRRIESSKRGLEAGESSFNILWSIYTTNAKRKELEFLLSREEFRILTQDNCFYCGVGPEQKAGTKNSNGYYTYNGIDRVDSNLGYVLENVVSCCGRCNFRKSKLTTEEFLSWIKLVYEHSVLPTLQI